MSVNNARGGGMGTGPSGRTGPPPGSIRTGGPGGNPGGIPPGGMGGPSKTSGKADLALAAGYVVVSPGCRGRDNQAADGTYYGKAGTCDYRWPQSCRSLPTPQQGCAAGQRRPHQPIISS